MTDTEINERKQARIRIIENTDLHKLSSSEIDAIYAVIAGEAETNTWTPISEGHPKRSGKYLITYHDSSGEDEYFVDNEVGIAYYSRPCECWRGYGVDLTEKHIELLAWKEELPAPYVESTPRG